MNFWQKIWHKKWRVLAAVFLAFVIFFASVNFWILHSARDQIFAKIDDVPPAPVALVLGASVRGSGVPSDALADRLATAVELFEAGKVEKILASGDHGKVGYDETEAMKNYFVDTGIPPEKIFLDHAGFDTFDSLFRAHNIFGANEITIVTQKFHLPRAIWLADNLDLEANGIVADRHVYLDAPKNEVRESLARIKAFLDVVLNSQPKFLGEPISLDEDARVTWD